MWQDTHPLVHDLIAPGVELHCLVNSEMERIAQLSTYPILCQQFGTGVDTAERLIYSKSTPIGKATIIMGDGDGTVNVRSLAACSKWVKQQSQPVYVQAFPKRDHMAVLYVNPFSIFYHFQK